MEITLILLLWFSGVYGKPIPTLKHCFCINMRGFVSVPDNTFYALGKDSVFATKRTAHNTTPQKKEIKKLCQKENMA